MVVEEMADAGVAADQDELLTVALARNASVSQNRPLTVTSMTSSGVSLQVARWTTWVTPSIARSTPPRSEIVPFTTSSPGAGASARLWRKARMTGRDAAVPPDEVRSDLSGRARDQEPHLILTGPIASGVGGPFDREAEPCFPIYSLSSRALKRAPGGELRRDPFSNSPLRWAGLL